LILLQHAKDSDVQVAHELCSMAYGLALTNHAKSLGHDFSHLHFSLLPVTVAGSWRSSGKITREITQDVRQLWVAAARVAIRRKPPLIFPKAGDRCSGSAPAASQRDWAQRTAQPRRMRFPKLLGVLPLG
jgi:hypothetical protein